MKNNMISDYPYKHCFRHLVGNLEMEGEKQGRGPGRPKKKRRGGILPMVKNAKGTAVGQRGLSRAEYNLYRNKR